MPNTRNPRSGSLQFWPRKRSKRNTARIRTFADSKDSKLTGFAGYKVGMAHVQVIETNKFSHRKGQEISIPVTIIECPPVKIASIKLYKKSLLSLDLKKEILLSNDKNLSKKLTVSKKDKTSELDKLKPEDYSEVRVLVYTQPNLIATSKKKPDVVELNVGGNTIEEKIKFVKENVGKDILLTNTLAEGDLLDLKTITRGKGFQGPVKRFGIHIRESKSEKAIRNPGSLGPWKGQGGIMWRIPHAGKMGRHQRTEYNKQVLKIYEDSKEVNPKSGLHKYGVVKNPVVLIKGSVGGSKKRLVVMQNAMRVKKAQSLPTFEKIVVE
jgi:large subunit ribosomal protein L3